MTEELKFSEDQLRAIKAVEAGKNVFLTGGAGVGKSAVVKEIMKRYAEKEKNVVVLAPTGKAALNVGGETIHRFFRLKTSAQVADLYYEANKLDYTIRNKLKNTDLVIIDEISMVRRDVFDVITAMMLNARFDLQLVVVGDFQQLPPVVVDKGVGSDKYLLQQHYKSIGEEWHEGAYAFQASSWLDWQFETILLEHVFRQSDADFIKALNIIARGDPKGNACKWIKSHSRTEEIPDCTWICSRNNEVDTINNLHMSKLTGELHSLEAKLEGDPLSFRNERDCPVPKTLELKVGALVMARVNDQRGYYVNGSVGKIIAFDEENKVIKVDFGKGVVDVVPYTWDDMTYQVVDNKLESSSRGTFTQYPLVLAYAITVHKSQGATLEQANIKPMCFENGQLYTMLSRVKSIEGIYIAGQLNSSYCKSNSDVVELYAKMRRANSERAGNKIPPVKFTVKVPAEKEKKVKELIKKYLFDESFAQKVHALM